MAELSIDTSKKPPLKALLETPMATIIASVLSTFIIAGIFFKLTGPVPISIQQTSIEKQSGFEVSGEGSVNIIPDVAEVTLGIIVNRPTVAAAQEEANQTINNISLALKENGLEPKNIQTQNYSVNPQYSYQDQPRSITSYTVSANLKVKLTDFSKLNQAIDSAVSLGANQVGGINFTLSDKARAAAENQARQQAVSQAKQKAKSLSQAAGVKLGRIVNIQESTSRPPTPIYRTLEASAADQSPTPATQIEPGSTEVRLTITLSYEIL